MLYKIGVAFISVMVYCSAHSQVAHNHNENSEQSSDKTVSKKHSKSVAATAAITRTVAVNAILLQEYINAFELDDSKNPCPDGADTDIPYGKLLAALGQIRILSNTRAYFPFYDYTEQRILYVWQVNSLYQHGTYVFRPDNAHRADLIGRSLTTMRPPAVEASEEHINNIIFQTLYVNEVLSQAADILRQNVYSKKSDLNAEVRRALCKVSYHKVISAVEPQVKRAFCTSGVYMEPSNMLGTGFSKPFLLQCSPVFIDADAGIFRVDGRPTLSQDSINGEDVRVSIRQDKSESTTADVSRSTTNRNSRLTTRQVDGK